MWQFKMSHNEYKNEIINTKKKAKIFKWIKQLDAEINYRFIVCSSDTA